MAATRIRWDRLGRWALIAVFAFVLYLYIGPAVSWVSTYHQAGEKRAEVAQLKQRNDQLKARRKELKDERALEREARRLGMVKAGEKAFVVQLPPR
jgi:cell division protein FtsB